MIDTKSEPGAWAREIAMRPRAPEQGELEHLQSMAAKTKQALDQIDDILRALVNLTDRAEKEAALAKEGE